VEAVATLRREGGELQLAVAATARATGPLYTRVDTVDYLMRTFRIDPESTAEARRALAEKAASGVLGVPADPFGATLLQLNAAADTPLSFQGVVSARRSGGSWSFSLLSGGFAGSGPQGDIRSSFGNPSFALGDPDDEGRLRREVADFQAFATRAASVRRERESAEASAAEERKRAFLALIAPGRVFRGRAIEAGEQQGTTLFLEIADVSAEGGVTAFLRNEGSWRGARTFQGTWSAEDAAEAPTLNLVSPPEQAVLNAGPFVENTQTWTLALHADPQGGLSEQNSLYQYRFQPISPDQVAAAKTRLEAEFNRALAATEPGMLYHGTAVSRASGAAEPILLRFGGPSDGGQSLRCQFESTTRSWKRPLHGLILGNSRRSGGEPIRLQSGGPEAVDDAPADSVLGDKDDLDIHLGFDGSSLVGGDAQYAYQLAPAGEADLKQLEAARSERARFFLNAVRTGIEYDGLLREEQGFVARARLEIGRVDPQTGAVAARVDSLEWPNVHRDFVGTCDPSGSSIVLVGTNRGFFDSSGEFDIPFLIAPSPATLHLALTGTSITGVIEGNPHWVMEFPAATFLAAPTEGVGAGPPPAGAVFPAFPEEDGAYLLLRGSWAALPRNNGHVVVETVKEPSGILQATNIADALTKEIASLAAKKKEKKISYLEFDGKDPLPESTGQAVVLCLVGPAMAGHSKVQITSTEMQKEGQRRVEIGGGSPEKIVFGDELATYTREVSPGHILITTTSALGAGSYALNVGGGFEFRQD
jgi:hypothetical protein